MKPAIEFFEGSSDNRPNKGHKPFVAISFNNGGIVIHLNPEELAQLEKAVADAVQYLEVEKS